MPLLRILHDNARGAIIGLLSCMRSRLRKEVAASNLAAFLHPSRADVTMDFNQPRAWVDPHTEVEPEVPAAAVLQPRRGGVRRRAERGGGGEGGHAAEVVR